MNVPTATAEKRTSKKMLCLFIEMSSFRIGIEITFWKPFQLRFNHVDGADAENEK